MICMPLTMTEGGRMQVAAVENRRFAELLHTLESEASSKTNGLHPL
jgi:hypothetical protein